jgi:hypothetical protein
MAHNWDFTGTAPRAKTGKQVRVRNNSLFVYGTAKGTTGTAGDARRQPPVGAEPGKVKDPIGKFWVIRNHREEAATSSRRGSTGKEILVVAVLVISYLLFAVLTTLFLTSPGTLERNWHRMTTTQEQERAFIEE